jgi:predicted phosphate transport protein (TIGR00153 family)
LPRRLVRNDGAVIPRARPASPDRELFELFIAAGANIRRVSELLDQLLATWPDDQGLARDILICEQEGDRITHDIVHRINVTPAIPLDRSDVHGLATALDDIVDYAEEVADLLGLYKVEAPMAQAQELAGVLRLACESVAAALDRFHDTRDADLNPLLVEVHRLENDADRIFRGALASLFESGIDPMVVIRWKDLVERIEQAIDSCEHAANLIEGIALKHAQ